MDTNTPESSRRSSRKGEGPSSGEATPSEKPASVRSHNPQNSVPNPEANLSLATQPTFPDGGFRAWSVVFGGWCCLFASFGWIMCMGIFQDFYEHNLLSNYSSSEIAWIPSMQLFLMFALAPLYGKIFDDEGPFKLLVGGTMFHVFGLMMLSLSTSYYQIFLAQGVCSAIGTSALFYAGNNTVGRWFARRRALAIGLVSSGSSSGGLVIS